MCGILGEIRFDDSRISKTLFKEMLDQIAHRGPDGYDLKLFEDGTKALGHRRLAIIDLSDSAKQPMSNEDETIWIVFNGEIYNYLGLTEELKAKGHRFKSRSDTEVIIHGYEEWGMGIISKMNGMFAIGILDLKKKRLALVRDRVGIKPLYYYHDGTARLIFASEIKSIVHDRSVKRILNQDMVPHYLSFGATINGKTLFKGIDKLEAGQYIEFDLSDGSKETTKYWDLPINDQEMPSDENLVPKVRELIEDSINIRLQSDVPVGTFLSGGLDSSTIVAVEKKYHNNKVKTFNVGYDRAEFGETEESERASKELSTEHHNLDIDSSYLTDYLERVITTLDDPNGDTVCVPLYYVSTLLRKNNVIVVLSGEGGDEVFFGYDKSYAFGSHLYSIFGDALLEVADSFKSKAPNGLKGLVSSASFARIMVGLDDRQKDKILTDGFKREHSGWRSLPIVKNLVDKVKPKDYSRKMLYCELKIRTPELLLMRLDKITMQTSNEGRVPLYDYRLVELSSRLNTKSKFKNGINRYLLKEAFRELVPSWIINRKKKGFGPPVVEWLFEERYELLERVFSESGIYKEGILDKETVLKELQKHKKDKTYSLDTWILFTLFIWYDYWIQGKRHESGSAARSKG